MEQALQSDDLVDIGEGHHKAGRLPEAEAHYRKALDVDPDHPGALYFLANLAYDDGRLEFATQLAERLLRGEPNDAEAWHLLGVTALRMANAPRAVECLHKALAIQPAYVQAHHSLGNALCQQQEFSQALSSYRQAIDLKSDFEPAYASIGQIFLSQEKWDEAIAIFRKAIAANADSAQIRAGLEAAHSSSNQNAVIAANVERALSLQPKLAEPYARGIALTSLKPLDDLLAGLIGESSDKNADRAALTNTVLDLAPVNRGVPATKPAQSYKAPIPRGFESHYNDYQYTPSRFSDASVITIDGHDVRVLSRHIKPEIVVFGNVLNDAECELLIELSRPKLQRAPTFDRDNPTGQGKFSAERTSEGTGFLRGENALIRTIETRLAKLLNLPPENGEELNILYYVAGAEYRPHYDFFAPEDASSAAHLRESGQRIATFLMYLSDVESGGETIFPEIDFSYVPRKGGGVYFSYCDVNGKLDRLTLHGGAPVKRGEKWVATKWIRQRGWRVSN